MSKFLFKASLFLIMIWAIGFWGFHAGGAIHTLLVIAFIMLIARLFYNKSTLE